MNRKQFLRSLSAVSFLECLPLQKVFAAAAPDGPFKVAVIGHTGRGNFGHGLDSMWASVEGVRVVAICDAGAGAKGVDVSRYPQAKPYEDYHRMLAEIKPEIVAIGPRHADQHFEMAAAAAQAGVRGVYMEKPFVRDLREADDLAAACARTGMRLAVAHRNRYHPALPVLQAMLSDGKFGKLVEIRCRGKEDLRGGALDLWVLGSHVLNLAAFLGGTPVACSAGVFQDGQPVERKHVKEGDEGIGLMAGTEVHARFELESGVPLFFDSVKNLGQKTSGFGVQLICSEAVVDLRMDMEPMIHVRKGNPFNPTAEPAHWVPLTSGGLGVVEPLKDIKQLVAGHGLPARDLLASIRDGRDPLCGVGEATIIVEMIASVFESHRLGGGRVSLPLHSRVNPLSLM
jgi:predicted dehydrogenase